MSEASGTIATRSRPKAALLLGLGLVWLTQLEWIDGVVALAVAGHIGWTALGLIRRSFDGLMDRALPDEEQAKVRLAIQGLLMPGMDYHALRTRRAGSRRFADFHLLVPGVFTVRRAHEITERIEEAIRAALPAMEVTVHVEPSSWVICPRTPWPARCAGAVGETDGGVGDGAGVAEVPQPAAPSATAQ